MLQALRMTIDELRDLYRLITACRRGKHSPPLLTLDGPVCTNCWQPL